MTLVSCQNLSRAFGSRELFKELFLTISAGKRIGLVGPNGAGKSTLLKIIAKHELPDQGEVIYRSGLKVGYVPQFPLITEGTVEEAVMHASKTKDYTQVRATLGLLGFSELDKPCRQLSGGWLRRLSLAESLVNEPDLLLLDEPTNHLDLEGILWLENFLLRTNIPYLVISHDRLFLDRLCNQILEISPRYPAGYFLTEGSYFDFLTKRSELLLTQKGQQRGLQSKYRREEAWLKSSPKARTTKSRSRIQEAARIEHNLAKLKRLNQDKKADFALQETGLKSKKLLQAKNLSREGLFSKIDLRLMRGDRLGVVGENGSGKSTLLKMLAQELKSDAGQVKLAEGVTIHLFDQQREKLNLDETLREGLSFGNETVKLGDKELHVVSFAERFLFDRDRLDLPLRQLSGGERARVLIARLMLKPCDLLLLDEPTNDLDIDTLEILEESLDNFEGAVILVTHDRTFMDRVADQLLSVSDGATFDEMSDWLAVRKKSEKKEKVVKPREKPKNRLSYLEQRELDQLVEKIAHLEEQIEALSNVASDDKEHYFKLGSLQKELDQAWFRWEELEG